MKYLVLTKLMMKKYPLNCRKLLWMSVIVERYCGLEDLLWIEGFYVWYQIVNGVRIAKK
jgi:hypothetical protein